MRNDVLEAIRNELIEANFKVQADHRGWIQVFVGEIDVPYHCVALTRDTVAISCDYNVLNHCSSYYCLSDPDLLNKIFDTICQNIFKDYILAYSEYNIIISKIDMVKYCFDSIYAKYVDDQLCLADKSCSEKMLFLSGDELIAALKSDDRANRLICGYFGDKALFCNGEFEWYRPSSRLVDGLYKCADLDPLLLSKC